MDAITDFVGFPSIPRLSRECIVTEKLDGTNAQIWFKEDDTVLIGSRNRWLTPEDDNFGFARWVTSNLAALKIELGYGQHFGEWWGKGINKRYNCDKRFSLFNTTRWADQPLKLCSVVPVLYRGIFDTGIIDSALDGLRQTGSVACPGCMNPEGIVVFHVAANQMFKKTLDKNDGHKGA